MKKTFGNLRNIILLCLLFMMLYGMTLSVGATGPTGNARMVIVYSSDVARGRVSGICNGQSFNYGVRCDNYDSFQFSAIPFDDSVFEYWTDNGVIVSKSGYYTMYPGFTDHCIVAHFARNKDADEDDEDEDDPYYSHPLNYSNTACVYAPGHAIVSTSITTNQVNQGPQCVAAFDSVREGYEYVGMYNISFAYAGKPIEKVDHNVQLMFDIPAQFQRRGRVFRMLRVYKGQPVALPDLDNLDNKVTFETDCTAAYALVYTDAFAAN